MSTNHSTPQLVVMMINKMSVSSVMGAVCRLEGEQIVVGLFCDMMGACSPISQTSPLLPPLPGCGLRHSTDN